MGQPSRNNSALLDIVIYWQGVLKYENANAIHTQFATHPNIQTSVIADFHQFSFWRWKWFTKEKHPPSTASFIKYCLLICQGSAQWLSDSVLMKIVLLMQAVWPWIKWCIAGQYPVAVRNINVLYFCFMTVCFPKARLVPVVDLSQWACGTFQLKSRLCLICCALK